MDTSNRKSVLKLIGGFAFAGIFCIGFHHCHHKSLPNQNIPQQSTPVLVSDPYQNNWAEHINRLKREASNTPIISYTEKINALEAQEKRNRIINIYNVVDAASYNATSDAIGYYMDNLDYYLDDPHDEIRFDPLIFEANQD